MSFKIKANNQLEFHSFTLDFKASFLHSMWMKVTKLVFTCSKFYNFVCLYQLQPQTFYVFLNNNLDLLQIWLIDHLGRKFH